MTSPACDRAMLVEALFDGRLGASERHSTERHLVSCAACSEERRELTRLRAAVRSLPEEITSLEHQRARLGLLRRAAAPIAPRAPGRRRLAILAAAAVFVPVVVWAAVTTVARSEVVVPPAMAPTATEAPSVPAPAPVACVSVAAPIVEEPVIEEQPVTPPPPTPRPPAPPPPKPARSEASRNFADAMDAIARGDFGAGAAQLDRFARENPQDPRAEEALYLEAIALERAGRTADAAAVARRYLAAYPEGAHAPRARRLAGDEK